MAYWTLCAGYECRLLGLIQYYIGISGREQWEFTFVAKSLTPTLGLIGIKICNDNPAYRPEMLLANPEAVQVQVGNLEKFEMPELTYNEDLFRILFTCQRNSQHSSNHCLCHDFLL